MRTSIDAAGADRNQYRANNNNNNVKIYNHIWFSKTKWKSPKNEKTKFWKSQPLQNRFYCRVPPLKLVILFWEVVGLIKKFSVIKMFVFYVHDTVLFTGQNLALLQKMNLRLLLWLIYLLFGKQFKVRHARVCEHGLMLNFILISFLHYSEYQRSRISLDPQFGHWVSNIQYNVKWMSRKVQTSYEDFFWRVIFGK